jgi:hypothetical protein
MNLTEEWQEWNGWNGKPTEPAPAGAFRHAALELERTIRIH